MLELDGDGRRVVGYREKPSLGYCVSMGIYVYEGRACSSICQTGRASSPTSSILLLEAGERVGPAHSEDLWFDIGTLGEYERAMSEFERLGSWPG